MLRSMSHGSELLLGEHGSAFPPLDSSCIRRPRLEAELTQATRHSLTVVTAPRGAGKTVLLADWCRHGGHDPTVWRSVVAEDNDPDRFWPELWVALALRSGGVASFGDEHGDDGAVSGVAPTFSATFASIPLLRKRMTLLPPTIVVLDDFHCITNREIVDSLAALIGDSPPHVRFVVAGRQDPNLRLHRLRVGGQLAEIQQSALRFTEDETTDFLRMVCDRPVSAHDVGVVTDRTDGWAAGLRFVAAALDEEVGSPSEIIRRFDVSFHLVADYFSKDVLADLPDDHVRFLVRCSILERMTAGLCEAITSRAGAGDILSVLARRNVFLSPMDSASHWYRLHPLFADFLRSRFARDDAAQSCTIHRKAAAWLRSHGDSPAALRHYVLAGELDAAFELGASTLVDQVSGGPGFPLREPTLPADLPKSYLVDDHHRIYATAAALLYSGRLADAGAWLDHLQEAVAGRPDVSAWTVRMEFLWTLGDSLNGDDAGTLRHRRQAVDAGVVGESVGSAPTDRVDVGPAWMAEMDMTMSDVLVTLAARADLRRGEPAKARSTLAIGVPEGRARRQRRPPWRAGPAGLFRRPAP